MSLLPSRKATGESCRATSRSCKATLEWQFCRAVAFLVVVHNGLKVRLQGEPMDDVDVKILRELRRDGRASFTALAKSVGTSEATVRARMKRLQGEGTIRGFTVRTAGGQVKALVEVNVQSNVHSAIVAKAIRAWDDVESVWEVTGDNDIIVVADCPDASHLNAIIDRIRDIPGTQATRSRLILREH